MVIDRIDGQELKELYRLGYSMPKLAEHFGVSKKTINRRLIELGVKRTMSRHKAGYIPASPENLRKYCRPPDGCLQCPFDDCKAGCGSKGSNKRTAKEFEWLKNAINNT